MYERGRHMKSHQNTNRFFTVICLIMIFPACAASQNACLDTSFQPEIGQGGKDVIWVPTPQALVDKMLDLAEITPDDFVIDLGSGDGRTVIAAAKRGVRALGIEYNPDMVALSIHNAELEGVSEKATFINADLFETDFSEATVITMFLLTSINLELRPQILALEPGTRIVSNTFDMGEWSPDEKVTTENTDYTCDYVYDTALLWIVPAKVEGRWNMADGYLTLSQEFQMISGEIHNGGLDIPIENGKLRGDQIRFQAGDAYYTGQVNENVIDGIVESMGKDSTWQAVLSE